ncbi:unnamed protein product [Dibothriocephalus latus]|uniref:Uncharacterized protein n=1 Tax=Dibothriocephalus latus TaxID=60516 RepID=A0A3P7MN40_DIBLA|nr:unnamed protein product [Dibothriocephalus latus]
MYEFRAHLQQKWESTRTRLEQIYQLRLFEDDASRMANWLEQQRHIFLSECTEIGSTAAQVSSFFRGLPSDTSAAADSLLCFHPAALAIA